MRKNLLKDSTRAAHDLFGADAPGKSTSAQRRRATKVRASMKRSTALKRATPWWLTPADHKNMKGTKYLARVFTRACPHRPHDVDHIISLQGRTACGLHVPWNLAPLLRAENWSKKHRLDDDSPDKQGCLFAAETAKTTGMKTYAFNACTPPPMFKRFFWVVRNRDGTESCYLTEPYEYQRYCSRYGEPLMTRWAPFDPTVEHFNTEGAWGGR